MGMIKPVILRSGLSLRTRDMVTSNSIYLMYYILHFI